MLAIAGLVVLHACASGSKGACPEIPCRSAPPSADARSSAVPAVDTTGWATAEQSAFANGPRFPERDRFQCLSDLGCAAPANVPTCPADVEPLPIDALMAHPERRVGKSVLVRGRLIAAASTTQMGCLAGCCNKGDGGMLLTRTERAGGSMTAQLARLSLVDRTHPDAFHCARDDSMTCCGFETPERDVVVSARLVEHRDGHALENPALCVLRPESDRVPDVRFDANGCTADGVHHPWGEHFKAGALPDDLRCACYGGRLYCRADFSCFRGGQWFAPDEERPISNHCGGFCACRHGGAWECNVRPCGLVHVEFAPTKATLDDAYVEHLKKFSFPRGPARVEVRGHADPGEGKDLLGLAGRRAELVARIVVKSGVASDRIEVRALGEFDPDERRGPRPEQSRVVVVVWAPELPELSPPKPPE